MLVGLVLAIVVKVLAQGTVPLTTVQDTVYNAEGQPASGTVLVSWSAFTTAGGSAVPAGNTSVTIGANGVLTVALAPNAGGTPMGSYYTAVFHLNDGTVSRQYWVIPVAVPGGGPAKLAAIENQVLPTSVAMQTVSKAYVDNAIAAAETGFVTSASPYVLKAGDTMTGPLVLPADPVNPTQAADKNYVDENVAAIAAGLGQKVSLLPSGGQVVAQPSGTTLGVNLLNGEVYASQYASGSGNNGIRNALGSADCASGCVLNVEHNYGSTEQVSPVELPSGTAVLDTRDGTLAETVANPLAVVGGGSAAQSITQVETMSPVQLEAARPGSLGVGAYAMTLNQNALAGGSNLFPNNIETPPYFKNTYGALALTGVYNTQGQHVQLGNQVNCYGVGDCIGGTTYITSSGGYRDNGDEGTHPADLSVAEDVRVFEGSCTTGCTTGATSLTVTTTANAGTQGDGRFLIDVNPAKTIGTGTITGGSSGIFGTASFSGTSFPVSVLLQTAQAAMSQAANMAPGTVTLGIATSGVAAGFAETTASLPASSGVACVADETNTPNYEMANYSVVDGSHLQLTLNKPHLAGAAVAVGGLCGYGLEQKADTRNGIRQVFPVVASTSATSLYYADAGVFIVGYRGVGSTSGFLNVSAGIAGISRSGNVVTVTTTGLPAGDPTGLTFTVSGVADPSYNGSFVVTTTSANTLTYANAGADSTSSGGTLSYTNGAYALYPMAEVLSVFDAGSGQVDGSFTLAPNTVAWAAGDAVEEPHYYKQATFADTEAVTQYVPRPIQFSGAGKVFYGQAGPGLRGWEINNGVAASNYLGGGGTYSLPDDAYVVSGAWTNDFELTAGASDVMKIHCNLHDCGRWDSDYNLFDLDAAVGEDTLTYFPQSNTATWTLGGAQYEFAPGGFTAGTINVGTLNATTITGGVSGGAITSGTVSAARLPLFGPSGTSHAAGIVPDPGATAGATRYLREDGTWSVPAGGSGGGLPTASVGTLAGVGATITISGTNNAGVINLLIGGSGSGATLAQISFNALSGNPPYGCALMPRNSIAALASSNIYTTAPTNSGWTIAANAITSPAGSSLVWSYQCF